jgi:hypothetical protein
MMGGSGLSMQQMHNQMTQNGGMGAMYEWMHQSGGAIGNGVHDTVWKALAGQLGLTPEELTTQVQSGKTLAQLAQEKGVTTEDLAATMEKSMRAGFAQAVKDGTLTQAQADGMLAHMAGQYEWMLNHMGGAFGNGGAIGNGGMMGNGSMMGNGASGNRGGMMGSGRQQP